MNNENKLPDEFKYSPETKLGKKLDNFWYYHKWKVIVGLFLAVVLIVCVVQCATRETDDIQILFGGALSSSDKATVQMREAFSDIEPDEIGKDGVGLNVMEIYADEYVADSNNNISPSTNNTNYSNLCSLITSGEYSILIIDKWIYEDIKDKVGFRDISEFAEDTLTEDQILDKNAVYFKKTAFAQKYSATFEALPDDVVICLCIYSPYKSSLSCGGSSDAAYEDAEIMFKAILNYK